MTEKKNTDMAKDDGGAEPDRPEAGGWLASAASQAVSVALLVGVLYFYRLESAPKLVAALTAVIIAVVIFRFSNIKKLTSKLVTFEMQPAVRRADAATTRANKAAQEAKETAADAASVATEAKAEIAEAQKTIAALRKIGATLATTSLDILGGYGLWGAGHAWSDKLRLRDELKGRLREAGVAEPDITSADKVFAELLRYQLPARVLEAAREACLVAHDGKHDPDCQEFEEKTIKAIDFRTRRVPTPAQLREVIGAYVDEDVEHCLAEYEHFEKVGALSDPTVLDDYGDHDKHRDRVRRKVEARAKKATEAT